MTVVVFPGFMKKIKFINYGRNKDEYIREQNIRTGGLF